MPTSYQHDSLQAMFGLFLQAQGYPLPLALEVFLLQLVMLLLLLEVQRLQLLVRTQGFDIQFTRCKI